MITEVAITGADLPRLLPGLLPRLWAFALRISGDRHDAEDLVQRACVHALERSHHLRSGSSPLPWMFSIIHSLWISEIRSRNVRRRSREDWTDSLVDSIADPLTPQPEDDLMHRQLIAAVHQLPDGQREVMLLVAAEGFSYKEAAQILEVPLGTVMSRMSRARQSIAVLLKVQRKVA
ncbi:RNA polymerase sigma factor [Pseudomonas sp. SDO524_S393]